MQTGDAIFWKGETGLSKEIAKRYGGYSHVSLVVNLYSKSTFLIEALPFGLEFRELKRRLLDYDIYEMGVRDEGKAWHYQIDATYDQRMKMKSFALQELAKGVKYDYRTLITLLWRRVRIDPAKYICGEFVWKVWEVGRFVKPQKYIPMADDMIKFTTGKLIQIKQGGMLWEKINRANVLEMDHTKTAIRRKL